MSESRDDVLLALPEVCRRVGLSRPSIYRLMSAGTFPRPLKVGFRGVRWPRSEIERWVASRELAGSEPRI